MKPGILKRQSIEAVPQPSRSEREDAGNRPRRCAKSVRLVEDAGVPRAIEVTCSCGEVTLVELAFERKDPR